MSLTPERVTGRPRFSIPTYGIGYLIRVRAFALEHETIRGSTHGCCIGPDEAIIRPAWRSEAADAGEIVENVSVELP
ncbi:MAG: hypothetical protein ACRER7_01575, partial [Gammaproteobacteria bacterium]